MVRNIYLDNLNVRTSTLGFNPIDSLRYKNILNYRELPYTYNLTEDELIRHCSYFYGVSYNKHHRNYNV